MTTAEQQLREGRFEQAIQTASVLAFTSHETSLREAALALLEKAQAGLAAR